MKNFFNYFFTIENSNKILDGFIPDKLFIGEKEIVHSVIGIAKTNMDTYSAIFNPELLENNTEYQEIYYSQMDKEAK